MSLVDYQSSSGEESEDDDTKCEPETINESTSKIKLPVKILVPSLPKFEEETDEVASAAKKAKIQAPSGLLNMLPPPKFSGSAAKPTLLVPNVLKNKQRQEAQGNKSVPSIDKTATSPTVSEAKLPAKETGVPAKNEATDAFEEKAAEEESSLSTDYFSLEKSSEPSFPFDVSSIPLPSGSNSTKPSDSDTSGSLLPPCDAPEAGLNNIQDSKQSFNQGSLLEPTHSENPIEPVPHDYYYYSSEMESLAQSDSSSTNENNDFIKDEGFLRLQGKKMRGIEDVNIIDISGDSLLADKTDWHVKSITEEKKVTHSRKKGDMPTHVQKRKHQITYLAYQAKERELDLKNQWAQNRLTKQQTQSKYGF